jgi:hypothetical protein
MSGNIIFKLLKDYKKEHLIFDQNIESSLDLKLICNYLTNNICSDRDRSTPIKVDFLYKTEKEESINAIKNNLTKFKLEDVNYEINELGFRMNIPIEKIRNSIGIFGCSYTFGVGVPNEYIYTNLLNDSLKETICNFGIPGAGIQKITKAFLAINNFYQLKKAVFVLPSLYRYEFVRSKNEQIEVLDLIHNYRAEDGPFQCIYENFDDITFTNEYYKNLNLIKYNAKIHNTEIIFLTWCGQTYDLDRNYELNYIEDKINFIEVNEINGVESNKINVTDFARDGVHPGIRSHKQTFEKIYNILKND